MDTLTSAERPANSNTHSCGAWWTGMEVSHCGSCHLTFSSLTAFDKHQNRAGSEKLCRDPQEAGLVATEKPYGVLWSMSGSRPAHWATGAIPVGAEP